MTSELRGPGGVAIRVSLVRGEAKLAAWVFLYSLGIRILLSPVDGYKIDLGTFSAWFYTAAEHGPRLFYEAASFCDYPPLNIYIFWIFGTLAKWLSLFGTRFLVYACKMPSNLFDVATAFLIFTYLRRNIDFKPSLVFASIYAFNPATIFNTSVWGQFDAIYTFFLILALIWILESRPKLSAIAFTLGALSKPQSIALAPLFAFLIARKHGWKGVAISALASAATTLIFIIPFKWSNPLDFLVDVYLVGYGGYPYTSVNAFNVWAFHGFWKSDGGALMSLDFFMIGWVMFGALTAFSLYQLHKGLDNSQEVPVLFSAFVLLFGFFMLPTRIHERYLFPAISVLTLLMPFLKQTRPIYGILTFTFLSNQAFVLYFLNRGKYIPDLNPFVWIIALINLAAFLSTLILMSKGIKKENQINRA